MAKKDSYKVMGYAATKGEQDIEIIVKANNAKEALEAATKKEPDLAKHKDVRIYTRALWTRVQ